MRKSISFLFVAILLLSAMNAWAEPKRDVYYQVSTIESLMQGVYDGGVTCGALKEHGDLGLGTFRALDGEMVVLDGEVYQVRGDGTVHMVPDVMETPYAGVTFFDHDVQVHVEPLDGMESLAAAIKEATKTEPNMLYAVRVDASFDLVRTRSVDRQKKPYPSLSEAVKDQPEFTFSHRRGTLVGFYSPKLMDGLGVPGLHLHFLTTERDAGGHVLDLKAPGVDVFLDATPILSVELPLSKDFQEADLDGSVKDLHKVESARQ